MPSKHNKYGGSSASRWMNCPGSMKLSKGIPEPPESDYAKEGTDAHACLEFILKAGIRNPAWCVRAARSLARKYPEEMVEHGFKAARGILRLASRFPEASVCSEQRVLLSHIHPDAGGTVDAAVIEPWGTLIVGDYKYGEGIPVDVEDNTQLFFYAVGLAAQYDFDFERVVLVIIQPRAAHAKGPVRSAEYPIETLKEWNELFRFGIDRCERGDETLKDGPWCKWCRAGHVCPQLSSRALEQAQVDFDDPKLPDHRLSAEEMGRILDASGRIDMWVKQVRARAIEMLKTGHRVPGWKLVPSRAVRAWTDERKVLASAKRKFGDKAFSKKLLSPAQFEKVAGKEWVAERCVPVSSGLSLVPDGDSREAHDQLALDFNDDIT